jgi:hypothetical protein
MLLRKQTQEQRWRQLSVCCPSPTTYTDNYVICRGVTIRRGLDWMIEVINTIYTHHSKLQANTQLLLISTLYSSLLQILVFSVCYSLHCRFLETDFNRGIITVSLNRTLQISLYYSTHKNFYSLPDPQHSTEYSRFLRHLPTAANFGTLNPFLCCNCQLSRSNLFSIILYRLLNRLPQLFSLHNIGAAPTETRFPKNVSIGIEVYL